MKNYNSSQESNFLVIKKRLEERLKILETQKKQIKKNKKKRNWLEKITFFGFLFFIGIVSFHGYQEYQKNINIQQQILNNKISFFKEQKFRDSVNLLAMNIEIENRAYKKMEDSIQLEVDKKWYASISDSSSQNNEKTLYIKKKRKKKKKPMINITTSSLESKKLNFKNQREELKSNKTTLKIKEKKTRVTDNTINIFAIFPGCESKQKKQSCFDTKINRYIRKHINKKVFKKSGVGQVHVLFTISINGLVKIIKITGAINEIIKKEVIRVIESLPRFKPALNKDNISIPVLYNLAINI